MRGGGGGRGGGGCGLPVIISCVNIMVFINCVNFESGVCIIYLLI